MIKRILSSLLTIAFLTIFTTPLSCEVSAKPHNESLNDFLKNTENINASYKYPSILLTSNNSGKAVLAAHTPIIIRCDETITTKSIVSGSTVRFSVVGDVKDSNNRILIKSGTPVTAEISFSRDNGLLGRSGELTINDFHTTAVDGTYIPLSGTVSARPDDKMVTSVVLSVLICPLFLLMKGEKAELPAGSRKTAYTVIETYIKTKNDL